MFKDILLDLMQEKGINQRQLSISAEIPATTISGWVKAGRLPDFYALIKLSQYFDVSTDYLLGRTDDFGNINHYSDVNFNLSDDEKRLLNGFRGLSKGTKAMLLRMIEGLEKTESLKNA